MSKKKKSSKEKNTVKKPLSPFELVYSPIFQIGFVFVFLASFYFSYSTFANNYYSVGSDIERKQSYEIEVLNNLSKMVALPDEKPVFLEVDNPDLLKIKDAFYADVKSGDYVIFYGLSNKIIIYRKSENRIINIGPYLGGY